MKKLLSQVSKFSNLDLSYFARNGSYAIVQQIIGLACGLLVSYLFGHFVQKANFGEYNLVLSIVGMFTFLSLPGMDAALIKSVREGFHGSLKQSIRLKFFYSLVGIPLLLGFAFFYFNKQQLVVAEALIIAAVLFPLLNTFSSFPAFLTGLRRFKLLAFFSIFASVFYLLTFAVVVLTRPNAQFFTLGYFIALIIPTLIASLFCLFYVVHRKQTDPHLPSYGRYLTALSIIPWISGNIDSVVLAQYLGVENLATYAVANRFLTAMQKNFVVFYKPVTAKLAEQSPREHLNTIKKHAGKLLLIGIAMSICLWIATPFLVHFFFTDAYNDAIEYGQLLSLALIPLPLTWVLGDMVVYQKLRSTQFIRSVSPQVVKIILLFTIIPIWKIHGLIAIVLIERTIDLFIPLYFLVKFAGKKQ